jgi:transcriptional regulator of acetoin/glycerol metabolism
MEPSGDERLPQRARTAGPGQGLTTSRRLLASWQRSEDYGVSLESVEPVWAGSVAPDSLFFQCGHEVLTGLHQTLANEPVSLMLTDADGLVLNRFSGDTSLLRALDRVHLAPGFAFSEREAGTNGLGLALADRAPSIVRAEEHYSASLCAYTCAAVPVLDPLTGRLEGSVNITTWARSSAELLLALAQSAASTTSALMLARSSGRQARPQPKGGVFRVKMTRLEPGAGTLPTMSAAWTVALRSATEALAAGRVVAAVGEAGAGRATLLSQAIRRAHPHSRILSAAAPAAQDVDTWMSLWTPELAKPDTAVIVENVDVLPAWAAHELRARTSAALGRDRSGGDPPRVWWAVTAESLPAVPQPLRGQVDVVVTVPPLRERTDDVMPLARYAAHQSRMREVGFTAAAEHALTAYEWPGNADEVMRVLGDAAARTELVDVRHLPPSLTAARHRLTRLELLERDEIARVLATGGTTVKRAAEELGMSRATLYRKLAQYGMTHRPGETRSR